MCRVLLCFAWGLLRLAGGTSSALQVLLKQRGKLLIPYSHSSPSNTGIYFIGLSRDINEDIAEPVQTAEI